MGKGLMKYEYGECEICDTPMKEALVNQDFWIKGELVVVESVPAGVCPQCGSKVVNSATGRRILSLLENSEIISRSPRISVPKIKFDDEDLIA